MGNHTRRYDRGSPGLTAASAVLVAIVAWQSATLAKGPPANPAPISDTDGVLAVDSAPSTQSMTVTNSELVMNEDGSATLSAVLTSRASAVALVGVQVTHDSRTVEVISTNLWLPVPPGIEAIVGAASDAGGFNVPAGLAIGDVVDVDFVFDNGSCTRVSTRVVLRAARHYDVYPTHRSQLLTTADIPEALAFSCTDAEQATPNDQKILTNPLPGGHRAEPTFN